MCHTKAMCFELAGFVNFITISLFQKGKRDVN